MLQFFRKSFLFNVDVGNERFAVAQYAALTRQIPILYILLMVNAAALAWTHHGSAPQWQTLYVPGFLSLICIVRLAKWHLRRNDRPTPEQAVRKMRGTVILAGLFSICFGFWGVSLYPFGDAYQQSHIAFFLSISAISCVFCLMNLPPAALVTAGSVFFILIGNFMFSGQPVFTAISISVCFISLAFIHVTHSNFDNFVSIVRISDILEQKQKETEQLGVLNAKHALEDQLTGLDNRRSFFEKIDQVMKTAAGGKPPVIGLIDLDGFKPVNDVFGHAAGDSVLVETARRFRKILQPGTTIARIGGDEFGFILPSELDADEASTIANALCLALKDHYETPAGIARLSGSCGIVVSQERHVTAASLIEQADFALYQAKSKQNGGVEIFSEQHTQLLHERTSIERELRIGDLRQEFYLAFQPIVDLKTGEVVSFEALGRWHNATLGEISPAAFVPIAERCGLINDVSLILLRKAIDALDELPLDCRISFNLSARDICNHIDALKILSLVERSGVATNRLEFEITETALLSNFETAERMISLFRAAGIKVALDDFGTGYSSLSHVHRLAFDKLKIDRSFVQQMENDVRCRNIVKSVVDLSANLGIDCVAEGVESGAIAAQLKAIGCSYGQGYHFDRPLSFQNALSLARSAGRQRVALRA